MEHPKISPLTENLTGSKSDETPQETNEDATRMDLVGNKENLGGKEDIEGEEDDGGKEDAKTEITEIKSLNIEIDEKQERDPYAKGGRRERIGYIMASAGRGPLAVMSVFWVAAVLQMMSMDAVCDTAPYKGKRCTEYTFVDIMYTEKALENISYTASANALGQFQCTPNQSPCKHCDPLSGHGPMHCQLLSTPNDFYPCFIESLKPGLHYNFTFKNKVDEVFRKPLTCDCRGGQARLGEANGPFPSTVVPMASVATTIVTLVCIPIFGAFTDFTDHRKNIWMVATTVSVVLTALIAIIGLNYLWVSSIIMSRLLQIFFEFMFISIGAYLPDFGTPKEIIAVTGIAMTCNAGAQLKTIIIAVVVIVTSQSTFGPMWGPVRAAQIMCVYVLVWFVSLSLPAFTLMQPRSATKRPPEWEGRSLIAVSFLRLFRTLCEAGKKYREALKYLVYSGLMNAWGLSLIQYNTTYFYWQMQMNQLEVTVQAVLVLVTVVIGAFISGKISKRVHHKWIHVTICVAYCAIAPIQPTLVYQPSHKPFAYLLATMTGLLFGLFYGINAGCFAGLIPGGQEAEYMSVLQWFPYAIRWLPGVIYGALLEASAAEVSGKGTCGEGGQNHRWAFFSLAIYPLIALVVMLFINFQEAEKAIVDTLHLRESTHERYSSKSDDS